MKPKQIKYKLIDPPTFRFDSELMGYFIATYASAEEFARHREMFREKKQTLNSESVSYRLINFWEKEGLISDLRPAGQGWRRYSLIDRLWVEVIIELRKFGYPLEWIKRVKKKLERLGGDDTYSMPLLEAYFLVAFQYKVPTYLLFYPDGEAALATSEEFNLSGDHLSKTDSFICINLNRLIQRLYPDQDLAAKFKATLSLSPEELQVMFLVRNGNFETITVKRKDGKIDLIKATQTLSADARLTEIIKEGDYQDIEIKTAEGKTICIKRTLKMKV